MKISVIIPVYNVEKHLEAAINSVLAQGGAEIEIIAIDDKSTDSSADLLRRLANNDSRIKAYFNEENQGVANVRNLGLEYASGDYIAFCDSDDILPEGAYNEMLSIAKDADLVAGGYDMLYDNGRIGGVYSVTAANKKSSFYKIFEVCSVCTKIFRRSFIEEHKLRFDPTMHIGEDVVFLAELYMCNPKCVASDAIVYHYCQHNITDSRSLTHTYSFNAFSKHIECKRKLLEICNNSSEAREYVYVESLPYISAFVPLIVPVEDREKAFSLYKEFLSEYDFSNSKALFRLLTGVPYDNFYELNADQYIQIKNSYAPREIVLFEFENGNIGFRWIVKYLMGWIKYKFRKNN